MTVLKNLRNKSRKNHDILNYYLLENYLHFLFVLEQSFSQQNICINPVVKKNFFENFHRKCLSLKCSYLLGAGSGRPLIWLKRCASVRASILHRSRNGGGWRCVRNWLVFDENSFFDENHKFFSKIFFFKILSAKVHTWYINQFQLIYCVSKISISQGIHSIYRY